MSENAGRRATERVALDRLNDMLDERFPKSRLHVSRHGGRMECEVVLYGQPSDVLARLRQIP